MNEFFFAAFENSQGDLDFLQGEKLEISNTLDSLREKADAQVEIGLDIGIHSLKRQLLRFSHKITFFHLSSHHNSDYFPVVGGNVPDKPLEDILNNSPRLKLVFLNGCSTLSVLRKLGNVPIVIGTQTKIRDQYAMEVATEFYRLLTTSRENLTSAVAIKECISKAIAAASISATKRSRSGGSYDVSNPNEQDEGVSSSSHVADSEAEYLELDGNYVLLDNRKRVPDYDYRVTYNLDASKYPVNKGLDEVVANRCKILGMDGTYLDYVKQFPFLFTHHLIKFDPSNNNLSELNINRFKAIRDLFSDFLIFVKYCGISHYWQEIDQNNAKKRVKINPEIWNHVQYSWKSHSKWSPSLEFCKTLYRKIKELSKYHDFAYRTSELLENSEDELKSLIDCFTTTVDNDDSETFCKAEDFLYFFINKCSYLRHYKLISVYNSEFFKFRTNERQYEYILREFSERKKPFAPELKISTNCDYEVHAIYFVSKEGDGVDPPVKINLTPFYIDFNTHVANTEGIKLSYLNQYFTEDEDAEYLFINPDLGEAQNIKFDEISDVKNYRIQTHHHRIKFHIENLRQILTDSDAST